MGPDARPPAETPSCNRWSWGIRWFDSSGRRQSEVYDEYRLAASSLRVHEVEVDQITRGLRSPEPVDRTFDQLCDLWIEKRVPTKRDGKNDVSIIKSLRKHFGGMMLREIDVADADDYLAGLSGRHRAQDRREPPDARHCDDELRDELNPPWLARVPPFKKPKVIALGRDYRYLRNDEEVRRFLDAAGEEDDHTFVLYAMAVYTGMRAGELAGLEWGDVNFADRLIMVQRSFSGPTKSCHARPVPIVDALLPILREWKLRHPGRLVFTNRDGGMLGKSGRAFQEVLHRVLARAQFPTQATTSGRSRRHITFHGLRHSFASLLDGERG